MTRVMLSLGALAVALTALVASPADAFQVSVASSIVSLGGGAPKLELLVSPPQPQLKALTIETIVDTDGKTVASDLQVSGNGATFVADAPAALGAGLYKMKVSAQDESSKDAVYEVLPFKVTVPAEIGSLQLNGSPLPKGKKLDNPQLTSAGNDGLRVDVQLQSSLDKAPLVAHQAFLRFIYKKDQSSTYFALTSDGASTQQTVALNFAVLSKKFGYKSGDYSVQLILGDAKFDGAIVRELGDVELLLAAAPPVAPSPLYAKPLLHDSDVTLKALPEIKHVMRPQDTRPPVMVSLAFTAAVLTILVFFLLFVLQLQLNISKLFSGSVFVFGVGFLASLAGILILFVLYWIELTMFQTLGYLAALGAANVVFGHLTLKQLAQASATSAKPKHE